MVFYSEQVLVAVAVAIPVEPVEPVVQQIMTYGQSIDFLTKTVYYIRRTHIMYEGKYLFLGGHAVELCCGDPTS